ASFQMGVSKPDTEFWKIILDAEGCSAKDAVFIDDRRENCEAAASLGIRAIHFTSAESLERELFGS
ncbi:MAG: HAD-IA family hydrolase, partial [Treponema sp.]|nr:HAD-IA family hydrolase [Treponema sp.]